MTVNDQCTYAGNADGCLHRAACVFGSNSVLSAESLQRYGSTCYLIDDNTCTRAMMEPNRRSAPAVLECGVQRTPSGSMTETPAFWVMWLLLIHAGAATQPVAQDEKCRSCASVDKWLVTPSDLDKLSGWLPSSPIGTRCEGAGSGTGRAAGGLPQEGQPAQAGQEGLKARGGHPRPLPPLPRRGGSRPEPS